MRLLVFGMSLVSWRDTFASRIAPHISNSDVEVDIVGLGGGDAALASAVLPGVLGSRRYDVIVLDILARHTLAKRPGLLLEGIRSSLSLASQAAGMVILLEPYRSEVAPDSDAILPNVKAICEDFGAHFLDAANLVRAMDDSGRSQLFTDGKHTTAAGADYYGKLIAEHILLGATKKVARAPGAPSLCATSVLCSADFDRGRLTRSGFSCDYLTIPEGSAIIVRLNERRKIVGLVGLMGPTTGMVTVGTPEEPSVASITAYDRNSYYERAAFFPVAPFITDTVVIHQKPGMVDVALSKGQRVTSPREGKVSHIVWSPLPQASQSGYRSPIRTCDNQRSIHRHLT